MGFIFRSLLHFLRGLQSVAVNVANNDRTLKAKPYTQAFTLLGRKIKKHRNQLIYGALNDFLKAFVKSFVFDSAERQAPEPTLSENIIKLQIIDNHILYTMQSKSKSF